MRRTDHLAAARALTLLRVALGAVLVWAAMGKFTLHELGGIPLPMVSATWQQELPVRFAGWLQTHPDGVLGAVVRDLLVPNGMLVAGMIGWLQLLAGICLVIGLFTPVAAFAALSVAAALAIAAAAAVQYDARPYVLMMLLAVALMLGQAGEVWGMDGWRRERRRHREF
jgi:uncharacterized membrane protein YphA (DoxX/SURF4 family)